MPPYTLSHYHPPQHTTTYHLPPLFKANPPPKIIQAPPSTTQDKPTTTQNKLNTICSPPPTTTQNINRTTHLYPKYLHHHPPPPKIYPPHPPPSKIYPPPSKLKHQGILNLDQKSIRIIYQHVSTFEKLTECWTQTME